MTGIFAYNGVPSLRLIFMSNGIQHKQWLVTSPNKVFPLCFRPCVQGQWAARKGKALWSAAVMKNGGCPHRSRAAQANFQLIETSAYM